MKQLYYAVILWILIPLNITAEQAAPQSNFSYTDITKLLTTQPERDQHEPSRLGRNTSMGPTPQEHPIPVETIGRDERLQILCQAYSKTPQPTPTQSQQDMHILANDLELLRSRDPKNPSAHLFAKLNHTQTSYGAMALAHMLTNQTDQATLQKRQAFIKMLVANEAFFNTCDTAIKQIEATEPSLFNCLKTKPRITQELIDAQFFKRFGLKKFNENPAALEAAIKLGYARDVVTNITGYVAPLGILSYWLLHNFTAQKLSASQLSQSDRVVAIIPIGYAGTVDGFNKSFNDGYKNFMARSRTKWEPPTKREFVGQLFRFVYDIPQTIKYLRFYATKQNAHSQLSDKSVGVGISAFWLAVQAGFWGYKLYAGRNTFKNYQANNRFVDYLHNHLNGAATLVRNANNLAHLLDKHQAVTPGIKSHATIKHIFATLSQRTDAQARLIQLLQTDTFYTKTGRYRYTGRVLAAHKILESNPYQLNEFMQFVGEIDACLSIAKLYKKYQKEQVKYAFVDYQATTETPRVTLEGVWNPQIDPAKAVTNGVELGAPGKERNIILTGDNTNGKSTLLKALLICVLLSQTLGIVPATTAIMSPIDYVGSSLNVIDNQVNNESKYKAEALRIAAIIKAVRHCNNANKLCLIIMDELFSGTKPKEADTLTRYCAEQLAQLKNVIFVLATHFVDQPTKLEQDTNGVCKNYQLGQKGAPPFTMTPGINTSSSQATQVLQQALANVPK